MTYLQKQQNNQLKLVWEINDDSQCWFCWNVESRNIGPKFSKTESIFKRSMEKIETKYWVLNAKIKYGILNTKNRIFNIEIKCFTTKSNVRPLLDIDKNNCARPVDFREKQNKTIAGQHSAYKQVKYCICILFVADVLQSNDEC